MLKADFQNEVLWSIKGYMIMNAFLEVILSGKVSIELQEESVDLEKGASYTAKAGLSHRAKADGRVDILVIMANDTQ